jgi:hypothetical protein
MGKYNIKVDFHYIGYDGVDWIHLMQGKVQGQGCYEHGGKSFDSVKGSRFLNQLSDLATLFYGIN